MAGSLQYDRLDDTKKGVSNPMLDTPFLMVPAGLRRPLDLLEMRAIHATYRAYIIIGQVSV